MGRSLVSVALVTLASCVGVDSGPRAGAPARDAAPRTVADELEAGSDARAPVAEHAALARLAGDWVVAVEDGRGQRIGEGSAHLAMLHGGRFLEIDLELVLAGRPARATGWVGYDREAREHQSLWISDLETGMSLMHGEGSLDGSGLRLSGARGALEGTSRWRLVSPDELVADVLAPEPGGGERLLRRTVYRRAPR